MKKNKEQKLPDYKFNPATTEQLLELESLNKELISLHKFLNRPKSAIISMAFVPLLFNFLFVREQGWFHGSYVNSMQYLEEIGGKLLEKSIGEELNKNLEILCNALEKNSDKKLIQCLGDLKELVLNGTDDIIKLSEIAYRFSIEPAFLKKLISNYKYTSSKFTAFIINQHGEKLLKKAARETIDILFKRTTVVLGVIGQTFLIDPLLLNFWPGRSILQRTQVSRYLQYQLSSEDAAKEIAQLTLSQKKLKQEAEFNKILARRLMLIAVMIAIYNLLFSDSEQASPAITLACLATLSTAMKDVFQDISSWRQSRAMNAHLNHLTQSFNKITRCVTKKSWQYEANQTLDNTYFYIQLEKLDKLSAYFIARKLEYYLNRYQITTQHSNNRLVIIPADTKISDATANRIAADFKEAIIRFNQIKEFKKQLIKIITLLSSTNSLLLIPDQDKQNLPTARFHLDITHIPQETIDTIQYQLKEAGNEAFIQLPLLIIIGYHAIDLQKFKKLNLRKAQPAALQQSLAEYSPPPSNFSSSIRPYKKKIQNQNLSNYAEIKTITLPMTVSTAIIKWGKDRYDPSDEKCPVKPMRPDSLSQGRYFVVFKLKIEHMPKGYPQDLYEKLQSSVLEAKIGAPKQGWKFISPQQGEDLTTREKVTFSAKYRLYGTFGDMRLYAHRVKATTPDGDKFLHRVVGLDAHAHR